MKSVAIVVTFNREIQLIDCLDAILAQTEVPSHLVIIDNHSNEKTPQKLIEKGFIQELPTESNENKVYASNVKSTFNDSILIPVSYIRKFENDGGAGGFYAGMKYAYELESTYLWMMDDDGIPATNQLEKLIEGSVKNELFYCNALVTSIDNPTEFAFSLGNYKSVEEATKLEVLPNLMNPFNGTLIHRKVVEKIGMIKREMFIWGDETEYTNRVRKYGFKIGTITAAVHRHPVMKGKFDTVFPGLSKAQIVVKPAHFSHFYYRNLGYNQSLYASKKATTVLYWMYVFYFATRFKFKELGKFTAFFKDGTLNKFDRK